LIQERDKVVSLMSDLNKSKGDVASLQIQNSVFTLQNNMKVLMAENKKSEKENTTLTTQRDSSCPGVSKKV
jgi:hypothetical protein